ncbi:hypothetical protein BDV29DRAFT_174117 [Aspergillus leporis]|uniref:Methyltransferase type 11 domain-containing protein n=1 Tax=Aspergillus leporis TaxID=41062 RepID=A0A5N5X477_9EURO|nr:hypothetical protein BDV29DRAFT_174117 [Aspergillus leporis]
MPRRIESPDPMGASALDALTVQQGDYHHLELVESGSLDGVYTIETVVHATDLDLVLSEFHRSLKPGGRTAFYEYDHWSDHGVRQTKLSTEPLSPITSVDGSIWR